MEKVRKPGDFILRVFSNSTPTTKTKKYNTTKVILLIDLVI